MKSTSKFIGVIFVAVFAFMLGLQFSPRNESGNSDLDNKVDIAKVNESYSIFKNLIERDIDIFLIEEVLQTIDEKYVNPEDIDSEEITYGLAKGLVYSLHDPYSAFMTPDESDDFQEDMEGNLEGIGAELNMRDGQIVVVSPIRESPAAKAGLLPQDIILKVDGEEVGKQSLMAVVKKIRGEPGTEVILTIFRKGSMETMDIAITRASITIESVDLEIKGNIAILEVSQFGANTKEEFEKYLKEALLSEVQGIILDLRFNPGGYLDKAQDIVSAFVDYGKVVTIKSKGDKKESLFVSGKKMTDLPLVVVQNEGSASASEIVAGALQDYNRATVVGSNSFGKGKVQEVVPLQFGGSLRITISNWFTPNGRTINETGIEPDVFIENTIDDYVNDRDPQMDKALEVLKEKMTAKQN